MNATELVLQQEPLFIKAAESKEVSWNAESQFAIQAFQNNDYLAKIALQNTASVQNALINISAIGISLNPALKHAYLVPRKGAVCLDISYMGLINLAQESGSIEFCQAVIVYKNDVYKRHGIDKAPQHDYEAFGDRGEPVGAYCTVKLPSGVYLTGEMSKLEIEAIRGRSEGFKAGGMTPWKTDPMEMWKKTVVKRDSKYWPKSRSLSQAIKVINEHQGIEFHEEKLVKQTEPLRRQITPQDANNWKNATNAYKRDGNFNAVLERADISVEHQQQIVTECSHV